MLFCFSSFLAISMKGRSRDWRKGFCVGAGSTPFIAKEVLSAETAALPCNPASIIDKLLGPLGRRWLRLYSIVSQVTS
jgi:hypothetical protein